MSHARPRLVLNLVTISLVVFLAAEPIEAYGQLGNQSPALEEFQKKYMKDVGAKKANDQLDKYIFQKLRSTEKLKAMGSPTRIDIRRRNLASRWSLKLALNGVTIADLEALEREGFDFAKATTPSKGTNLARHNVQVHALAHDLVAVGTIKSVEMKTSPFDGYATTFQVKVSNVLKGKAPSSVVTVRQLTGRTNETRQMMTHSGEIMSVLEDPSSVKGKKYLFFLSAGMYKFRRIAHRVYEGGKSLDASLQSKSGDLRYALGTAELIENGRLVDLVETRERASKSSRVTESRVPESTEQVFSYIRAVGSALR